MHIPVEVADSITCQNLIDLRKSLKSDLRKPKPAVFVMDPAEDKKLIREYVNALDLIIEFFRTPF